MKNNLIYLLKTHSVLHQPVKLSSGKESNFFIDCKQTLLHGTGNYLAGTLMLKALKEQLPDYQGIAGIGLGGSLLVSCVSLLNYQQDQEGSGLPGFVIRKEAKNHGSQKLIEGDGNLREGMKVVILEDVITTGGNVLKVVDILKERGIDMMGVVVLVDREEGGKEKLEEKGLKVVSILKKSELM